MAMVWLLFGENLILTGTYLRIPKLQFTPRKEVKMKSEAIESLDDVDDEAPTLKMKVPPHLLADSRTTNWSLILTILACFCLWAGVIYLASR